MMNSVWQPHVGIELKNKILAVIGCGAIGSRIAQIAAFGLQMKVIGNDIRDLDVDQMKEEFGFTSFLREFDETVHNADFVTIHIPLIESTKYFINSDRLKEMPQTAWLINTSRGAIIDEIALYEALKSGRIAGAALDVFVDEPYKPLDAEHDLRQLNNVILTPHIGSTTREANQRMAARCLRNINFAENGEYVKMDLVAGPIKE
jgi:phosphoglycerate dehydrogenase-like enzyme